MPSPFKAFVVVEGIIERDAMQKVIDPNMERILFLIPFDKRAILKGLRAENIFCRWPNQHWWEARKRTQEEFQDWVRQELTSRLIRGGDFQYI